MTCPIKIELDNEREERMKKQKIQRRGKTIRYILSYWETNL